MKDWVDKRLKEIKLPDKVVLFPLRQEDIERRKSAGMQYDRFCGDDARDLKNDLNNEHE